MWRAVSPPGLGTLPGKRILKDVLSLARSIKDIADNPEYHVHNRGKTYLHELMHLNDLVNKPHTEDIALGPARVAKLASLFGAN